MSFFSDIVSKLSGKQKKSECSPARATSVEDKASLIGEIKSCAFFKNISDDDISEMIDQMESIEMGCGEVIVNQGEEGDYYYLLVSGSAEVLRSEGSGAPNRIAEVPAGASFGEDALISNEKRNATVKMVEAGKLLRLGKDAFDENVKDRLVSWLSPADAQRKIAEGGRWLDVREESGEMVSRLSGAVAVPLSKLRENMDELDKDAFYVCYCQNGRLSSTAAFLLAQRDYGAAVMRGGLQGMERAKLL